MYTETTRILNDNYIIKYINNKNNILYNWSTLIVYFKTKKILFNLHNKLLKPIRELNYKSNIQEYKRVNIVIRFVIYKEKKWQKVLNSFI